MEEQNLWKSKLIFWARMIGWFISAAILPVATFAFKFGLFRPSSIEIDSLGNAIQHKSYALNGWGIISCFIVGMTIISMLKEVAKSYTGYSLTKQTIEGVIKTVLPLVIAYGVCYFLHGVIEQIMFCLAVVIATRLIAIPLNPLPKWRFEKNGVEDYSEATTNLLKVMKSFKKTE